MGIDQIDIDRIKPLFRDAGITSARVFGSYARGDATPESDLDIIIEAPESMTLLEMIALERTLSDTLGIKVDLMTENSLSPYLRGRIEGEVVFDA